MPSATKVSGHVRMATGTLPSWVAEVGGSCGGAQQGGRPGAGQCAAEAGMGLRRARTHPKPERAEDGGAGEGEQMEGAVRNRRSHLPEEGAHVHHAVGEDHAQQRVEVGDAPARAEG